MNSEPELAEKDVAEFSLPSRSEAVVFRAKTAVFQARESLVGAKRARWELEPIRDGFTCVAEVRSRLEGADLARSEFGLNSGKIQNLRVAAAFLNGAVIPAGETFSFWGQIPRPTRKHGFAIGRELREGCLVPSIGGGLCQLSNALFEAAMEAGFEIVERHGHSKKVPGSQAETGRDATVFWNYVDLRFRSNADWQLVAFLNRSELVIRILSKSGANKQEAPSFLEPGSLEDVDVRSCESCGMTSCFRHPGAVEDSAKFHARTAWLVDGFWPEFGDWMTANRGDGDWLFTPLSQKSVLAKFGGRYPWPQSGFSTVVDFPGFTLKRSFGSRRLASQGAARQRAMLNFSESLAEKMARQIPHDVDRVVVSLDLLPFLWKTGILGGREFEVLMTRWPIRSIQEKLDRAAKRWPDSPTLADFRSDEELAAIEAEALSEASRWITPHAEMAKLAGPKAELLEWKTPAVSEREGDGAGIVFPTATAGRNGAWELREACRELDLEISLMGSNVEGANFWDGCKTRRIEGDSWLNSQTRAVVLPAWIVSQPRKLLQAQALGIPVITTREAGIPEGEGVTVLEAGDVAGLVARLRGIHL